VWEEKLGWGVLYRVANAFLRTGGKADGTRTLGAYGSAYSSRGMLGDALLGNLRMVERHIFLRVFFQNPKKNKHSW
jgi:hypothetical protein